MIVTFQKLKKNAVENKKLRQITKAERVKLQKVLVAMLKDFHDLCEKYGLQYFVTGGTALGLERNHRFIPWDDDIDVIMPRPDYDRLAECVEKEYKGRYWVQSLNTSNVYDLNFLKFRKEGTLYVELFENEPERAGICIDVFPLDNTYNNRLLSFLYGIIDEALFLAASCVRMYQKKERLLRYIDEPGLVSTIKKKSCIGGLLNSKKHPRIWYTRCENWSKRVKNEESRVVAVSSGRVHYFGEQYERGRIFPLHKDTFEGLTVYTAKENGYLLRVLYGNDYMTPHESGAREAHSLLELNFGE